MRQYWAIYWTVAPGDPPMCILCRDYTLGGKRRMQDYFFGSLADTHLYNVLVFRSKADAENFAVGWKIATGFDDPVDAYEMHDVALWRAEWRRVVPEVAPASSEGS